MKKLAIAAAVVTALFGMNAQATSTGTITFNGELVANSCDVLINGVQNPTVNLPKTPIADLTTAAQTAGETQFNMNLTNCAGTLQTVSAYFQEGATVNTDGRLDNQTTDGAGNVTLQLVDGTNHSAISAGQEAQITGNAFVSFADSTSLTLPYSVRYYAEGTTTAGLVTSSVVYGLQYK